MYNNNNNKQLTILTLYNAGLCRHVSDRLYSDVEYAIIRKCINHSKVLREMLLFKECIIPNMTCATDRR